MYAKPISEDTMHSEGPNELSLTSSSRTRSSRLGKLRNLGTPQRHFGNWNEGFSPAPSDLPLRRVGSSHLFSGKNLDQITEDDNDAATSSNEPRVPISPHKDENRVPEHHDNEPMKRQDNTSVFTHITSPHETLSINGKSYKPLKMIGKGGSSKVFEAIDTQGSVRAIKVVDMSGNHEEIKNSFLNEIRVLEKLQGHNRVIQMYDYQHKEKESKLYVVMEKGETDLGSILKNHLSDIKIKFYWEEMLNVVKVIHKAGIIHSDLKPANFLLVSGMLKIIDFGISTSIQSGHTSIITNSVGGTYNFMSPEAIQGVDTDVGCAKVKISYRSDVWSLGCILYLMTYGKTPFSDINSHYRKCQAIVDESHTIPFPEHSKDDRLVGIISLCLNRNPQKRPTVDELLSHNYLKLPSAHPPLSAIEEMCSPDTRRGILRAKNKLSRNQSS